MIKKYRGFFVAGGVILALLFIDLGVGYRQNRIIEERTALKKKIERLAYYLERTRIEDIFYPGKGDWYTMRLTYENVRPEEEMWIMIPTIKVFVQIGTLWKELSVNDMRMKRGDYSVERLNEPHVMTVKFSMPYKNYMELMDGYMHVKVKSFSIISAESLIREDVIEKDEDIFIYVNTAKSKGRVKTLLH
jgi:hypothetical protein